MKCRRAALPASRHENLLALRRAEPKGGALAITMNHQMRVVLFLACSNFALAISRSTIAFTADDAATIYQRCASCHGDRGHGDGPVSAYLQPTPADLTTSLKGKSDDWIAKVIKGGGAAVGASPTMPANPDLS